MGLIQDLPGSRMAYSMTGMGFGEVERGGSIITVEIKSVNNRYLEISCRLPSMLSQHERDVRTLVRDRIKRGKLYITVSVQSENEGILDIRVDGPTAKAVHLLLRELRDATGIDEEPRLEHILHFSEVFESMKEPEAAEELWSGVREAIETALVDLKSMRKQEGDALVQDIVGRVRELESHVGAIEGQAEKNTEEAYQKLVARVKKIAAETGVDEDRLHTEIALLADKLDVTEECVRLRSHHTLFMQTLEDEEVVGKKLNFLLQEMNREANTIGTKASDASVSHRVVEMKDQIEKLREQVQNLE